jgi:hypothetical protein
VIGKILRKKLESVGIDVDYVVGGRRKESDPGSCAEQNREIYDLCTDKIPDTQKKLMKLSTDVLEINKMISTVKKCVD